VTDKYYNLLKAQIQAENDYVDYHECSSIGLDFDEHNVCLMRIEDVNTFDRVIFELEEFKRACNCA
jgi:hypothetical protein